MTNIQTQRLISKANEGANSKSEIKGYGLISTKTPMTEEHIKNVLKSMAPLMDKLFLRMMMSDCGRTISDTSPLYYLVSLLDGLEEQNDNLVKDFFFESSISQALGFITLILLECLKQPDKETFGRGDDIKILQEFVDYLTAWEDLLHTKSKLLS